MDAKKLGAFIAQRRKDLNMTQADLAEQLHVTDKAISRWERGIGLPDINTIEPLSDALKVSLPEVMKAEIIEDALSRQETAEVIKDVLSEVEKKRIERRRVYIVAGVCAALIAMVLLFDNMGALGFAGIFLPLFGSAAGVCLIVISVHQHLRKRPWKTSLVAGFVLLSLPVLFALLLVIGFLMGGGPS